MRTASSRSNVTKGTLRNSILDGAFHSVMLGLLVSVPKLTALAISIGAALGGLLALIPTHMGQYIGPIGAVSLTPGPA